MMWWLLLGVALAGCDKVIGLSRPPPDAAVNGHDEDGDFVGDLDDVCPTMPDSGIDADGDGVGDDCDPAPNDPGDKVTFYPFTELPAGWVRTGNWTVDGEHLIYTRASSNEMFNSRNAPPFTPPYTIEARVTITAARVDDGFGSFGVTANLDASSQGAACAVIRDNASDSVQAYSVGEPSDSAPITIPLDEPLRFVLTVQSDQVLCDISGDGVGAGAMTTLGAARAAPVGLEGNEMSARVDYYIIYHR